MRRRKSTIFFWLLMAACGAGVMWLPAPAALQGGAALLFAPVSHPTHRVMRLIAGVADAEPLDPESAAVPRDVAEVYAENARLRQLAEQLHGQLEALKELNADRDKLGKAVRDLSVPGRVVNGPAAPGEAVLGVLTLGSGGKVREGMPVVHYDGPVGGIAGRVIAANPAGATVRLITDPKFGAIGKFVRYDPQTNQVVILDTDAPFVQGNGDGTCLIRRVRESDLKEAKVEPGTLVVLSDDEWPEVLHGGRLGRVAEIESLPEEPGFAKVIVKPEVDLTKLREVMIVTRW